MIKLDKMKEKKILIVHQFFVLTGIFMAFSFIMWDMNPSYWSTDARVIACFFMFVGTVFNFAGDNL